MCAMPNETDIISKKLPLCYGNVHDNANRNNFFFSFLLHVFRPLPTKLWRGRRWTPIFASMTVESKFCYRQGKCRVMYLGNTFEIKSWKKNILKSNIVYAVIGQETGKWARRLWDQLLGQGESRKLASLVSRTSVNLLWLCYNAPMRLLPLINRSHSYSRKPYLWLLANLTFLF